MKALYIHTLFKETFAIFFGKFAKVWNREIFDLVALAKINSRKNVQFFGRESFFLRKIFFLQKLLIVMYVRFYQYILNKLIFIPLPQHRQRKEWYLQKLNNQKLHKLKELHSLPNIFLGWIHLLIRENLFSLKNTREAFRVS